MRLLSVVATTLLLPTLALASYCGTSGVPYSFEVLSSGAPVLGCAQPSCVVAPDDFVEDSQFLTDADGVADGFFRAGDRALKRYRHAKAPVLSANCSGGFSQLSCPRKNQWVGGIEYIDHPRQPLILQCCTFDGLRFSQEVGMTVVGPGEAITGGEVIRNGRQISFDVIANVRKIVQAGRGHKASYEVTVRRMNCLPDPPEVDTGFDKEVPSEVLKVLSSAKSQDIGTKEKFEKKETPEAKVSKNAAKKADGPTPPAQFGAKQYAGETENSINVDPLPVNSNIEPLPAAPVQQVLPVAPAAPNNGPVPPIPLQPAPPVPFATGALPGFPAFPAPAQPGTFPSFPAPAQPATFPGFPAPDPATGAFPGFAPPAGGFPTFPPMTFGTFAPFNPAVTPAPLTGYETTTSTWEAAIAEQPARPTYPNGYEVFPTIGTGYVTATPHAFMTLGTFAPLPGLATPAPATGGAPEQQQLPALASPPSLNAIEQTVSAPDGSAAVVATADGGNSATVGAQQQVAPAVETSERTGAVANAAPTYTGAGGSFYGPGIQAQGVQNGVYQQNGQNQQYYQQQAATGQLPLQYPQVQMPGYQPPTIYAEARNEGSPHMQHYSLGSPSVRPLSSLGGAAAVAPGAAAPALAAFGTFAPLPTFSFPTLPPVPATTPHPLFTLPPPVAAPVAGQQGVAPAQAQGTLLLPGIAPIQFPGLGPLSAAPTHKEK